MIYLLLSILFNTSLFIVIKYYTKYKVDTLQAIVVNYFVASAIAFFNSGPVIVNDILQKPFILVTLFLGILLIAVFILLAETAQRISVSAASVANKMSVIIPVIAAIFLYQDSVNAIKICGIVLALFAVYFTSKKENTGSAIDYRLVLLPVFVFIGSGVIDALINYSQQKIIAESATPIFVSVSFFIAGFIGLIIVIIQKITLSDKSFQLKNLVGGILLGIPNYLSITCIIKALNSGIGESSVLYPINNMGIVGLSAISALFLFKEKFSKLNWLGIAISILAIALIAFS